MSFSFTNLSISTLLFFNGTYMLASDEDQQSLDTLIETLAIVNNKINEDVRGRIPFLKDYLEKHHTYNYHELLNECKEKFDAAEKYQDTFNRELEVARLNPQLAKESQEYKDQLSLFAYDHDRAKNNTRANLTYLAQLILYHPANEVYTIHITDTDDILTCQECIPGYTLAFQAQKNPHYFVYILDQFLKRNTMLLDVPIVRAIGTKTSSDDTFNQSAHTDAMHQDPQCIIKKGFKEDYKEYPGPQWQWLINNVYMPESSNISVLVTAGEMLLNDTKYAPNWGLSMKAKHFLHIPDQERDIKDAEYLMKELKKAKNPYSAIWYSKNDETGTYDLKEVYDWYVTSKRYWLSTVH